MKFRLVIMLAMILLITRISSAASDPKPPQVTVSFVFAPRPLIQDGTARLVYEMIITNYVRVTYTLESISVDCGNRKFRYSGEVLSKMIKFAGESGPIRRTLEIAGGRTVLVFFMLQFENESQIPVSLDHQLHLRSHDGVEHALDAKPLEVEQRPPIIVGAPLRGSDWIAGDSVHNAADAAHRRALLFDHGQPYLAQRYAIDWVSYRIVNGVGTTWSGLESLNTSYFCYGAPVYGMTAGTVTEVLDGIPENVPHSGRMKIDVNFKNAGGNHVVIYIGYGLYAFYAHMQPGSIKVKVGDRVKLGEVIGRIGNSGNSTEPHLHEHIVNRPSFLAGQGVPYEFAHFEGSGPVDLVPGSHDEMFFKSIRSLKPFNYEYPAANEAVSF